MTRQEVTKIVGEGKETTIAELPHEPKEDMKALPAETRYFRWGKELPFLVVGYHNDKVVFVQVVGANKKLV